MSKERLLVIEDDEDILQLLKYNLAKEGYEVTGVMSGEEAAKALKSSLPDLVLLDLMLPGVDGLDVCRQLKRNAQTGQIPIIMLTAKGEEADIVTGLELGADDYITKPFSPRVMLARVRAVLRRVQAEPPAEGTPLKIHELVIHPGRHEVAVSGQPLDLTVTEFRLLYMLASRPGWVFTREQIVKGVHGEDYPASDRSVDVQVVSLRKKLGPEGKYLETVRGVGYRFKG
ncbi:MAG: response regulator transcription factor [Syntrophales bacterium]|nr:response regulator transcription factor [Syntrophales bacterium]MDD5641974.1 response regulator transcription factor [Syntrophales bacterium]